MFKNLEIFNMAQAMAKHAGQRQAIAAQNVANADTPDFKARDIPEFSQSYRLSNGDQSGFKSTRATHLHGASETGQTEPFEDPNGVGSPNGNTVSLENEMLKSLNAKRQHDRAMAIYKSSMNIIRATLSRS
ncbi:MAG: FlgB family protein [Pseudomonadota bacterium]